MPTLEEIRRLSPSALAIYKQQAYRQARAGDPYFSRLVQTPEYQSIMGAPEKPWWQHPLDWMRGVEKGAGAFLTAPFTPSMPGTENLPWFEREKAEYEAWEEPEFTMPWGGKFRPTKGLVEQVPWFATAIASGGLGLAGWAGRTAGIKGLQTAAQVGAKVLKPIQAVEAFPTKMAGKGIKAAAKAVIPKELAVVEEMWAKGRIFPPVKKQIGQEAPGRFLRLQEQVNDAFYGIRRMAGKVGLAKPIIPGTERDVVTLLTRTPGIANAGATRYMLAIDEIRRVAPDIMADDINTIIFANHAKEILIEKGAKRVMAGGFKDTSELDVVLSQLRTKLGNERFAKTQQAAEIVKRIYNEERQRLVNEGLISKELGAELERKYPWYNPLHYLEYMESELGRGKSPKPFTVISSGLRRLTEKGTEKEAVAPLEVMADQLVKNEVRIHKNQMARSIIKLALEDENLAVKQVSKVRPVAKVGEKNIPAQTLGDLEKKLSDLNTKYNEALGPATEDTARSLRIEEQMESIQKQITKARLGGMKPSDIIKEATVEPELVFRPVKTVGVNQLSYFDNGIQQIYDIPDWLYRETNILSQTISNPLSSLIGALNGISRSAFTSFSPPFVVSNMLNDTLTAFIKGGILPTETASRLIGSLKGLENDKIMQAFRLSGGYQQRFYGRDLAKEVLKSGGKVVDEPKSFLKRVWEAIPAAGEAGEQAPRMASFQKMLDKTLVNWRTMTAEQIAVTPQARKAAAEAVEVTINFGRGGYLVKAANPFVIFLNANMEAVKLPFRALRDIPAARWRLAGVAAANMGVSGYNLSYPEYFDIPNDIRWGSFVIMLPSKEKDNQGNPKPNYLTIIPRTREWGAFIAPLTYAMEKMYSDNPTDFGRFTATLAPTLLPISEMPAPQVMGEIYEQMANWDFYRSAPIVPEELQALPAAEQVQPWVSKTLAEVSSRIGLSPLRFQHAMNGIFGGAGRTLTSTTDLVANWISPIQVEQRIVDLASRYKSLTDTIERNKFLMDITSADKKAMFDYLKQPEKTIPLVSPIISRVYPERAGQLYRTGLEMAEKQTGISGKQTTIVRNVLNQVSDIYDERQTAIDKALLSQQITGTKWRELRAELSLRYQGALDALGIKLPNAAQVQSNPALVNQYYDTINTLAQTMPDRRAKAEFLAAGWYAIDLQEVSPWEKDWDTFYAMREAYKSSLSPDDRELLEQYLSSRMTPVEQQYSIAQELLRPYWQIEKDIWSQYPPELQQIAKQIDILDRTDPRQADRMLFQYPQIVYIRKQIAFYKKRLKMMRPDIAQAIRVFYSR